MPDQTSKPAPDLVDLTDALRHAARHLDETVRHFAHAVDLTAAALEDGAPSAPLCPSTNPDDGLVRCSRPAGHASRWHSGATTDADGDLAGAAMWADRADAERRAERAEAVLGRVREVASVQPVPGTPAEWARGYRAALADIRAALTLPKERL